LTQDKKRLEWSWIVGPRQVGETQVLQLNFDLDLRAADGGDTSTTQLQDFIEISVGGGDSSSILSDVPIASILTGMVGSAFSVPFFYTLWKERHDRSSRLHTTHGH
jgi:hypothetical protein